jgi:hypothetical protein
MRANKHTTTDEMWRNPAAVLGPGDDWRKACDGNAMNGSLDLSDPQLRQARAPLPSQRSDFVHWDEAPLGP